MKIAGITTTFAKGSRARLAEPAWYALLGFFSAGCCLDGRAPLAAGFLAACRPGRRSIAALIGAAAGAFLFLPFPSALRCCGILTLIIVILSAFQDTAWFQHPLFRPLTAGGATLAVELAYTLQMGLNRSSLLRLAACTVLASLLCHYCALLLRETSIPRRKAGREQESLRQRLRLSADALRSLYQSLGTPPPKKEENPAIIFDRAAEVVCRGCAMKDVCWNQEYVSTFNAFNDATPAMLERGRAEPSDFASYFASRCIHFPQLLSAINTEVTALLLRRQYRRQLEQERERTRGQYAQLGELVAQAMATPEATAAPTARNLTHQVAMAAVPKSGERICGDSVTWFQGGNRVYLLLSDGMGSGREAQRESQLALRLMERFLKAGIEAEPALKTLNAALTLRADERGSFTTIDLLSLDPASRQATLYKYGAAPTYIKRRGTVRRLTGTSLPAGLQETGSVPTAASFPLEEDAFVLLISDGVADSGDDQWLQNLLAGWQGTDPKELVALILREAAQRRHGSDDCSAICLYLPPQNPGKREV